MNERIRELAEKKLSKDSETFFRVMILAYLVGSAMMIGLLATIWYLK